MGFFATKTSKSAAPMFQMGQIAVASGTTWKGPDNFNPHDNSQNGTYGTDTSDPTIGAVQMGQVAPFDGTVTDAFTSWRVNSATAEGILELWRFRLVDSSAASVAGVSIGTIAALPGGQSTSNRYIETSAFTAAVLQGDMLIALYKEIVGASATFYYSASWTIEAA